MQALRASPRSEPEVNPRFRCAGVAYVLDPASQHGEHLVWDVYNLDPHGAFLETKGPLPVGEELDLLLEVGGRRARVRAHVARVQEPSWLNVGGVGIRFVDISESARSALDSAIADARALQAGAAASAPELTAPAYEVPILDAAALAEIRALDPNGSIGLLTEVSDAFGSSAPGLVEDIDRAHQKGDTAAMAAAAHSLGSSSVAVGALRLSELCREIEALGRAGSTDAAESLVAEIVDESERVARAVAALRTDQESR
jgi:HPt (histidine-containing phosphotransfer) domain-containing protein